MLWRPVFLGKKDRVVWKTKITDTVLNNSFGKNVGYKH